MIKKLITAIICLCIVLLVYFFQDDIVNKTIDIIDSYRKAEFLETRSDYSKNVSFEYAAITDNFSPTSYQDILNITYTALDKRYSSITFYCPVEYKECVEDVRNITSSDNEEILTIIGNLISPYNNYTSISVEYDTTGRVKYNISYLYDDDMIEYVDKKIDKLLSDVITNEMTIEEKVKAAHDAIVQTTEYDQEYEKELNKTGRTTYESNTAYGLFKNHLAICSGYADTMALILDKLGLENFKVASQTHIWNVVKINGKYLHVDATWDDPVNNIFGLLSDKYLLIDTPTLESFNDEKHHFDTTVYLELR